MTALTWLALVTLVAGLVIASALLAPWRIRLRATTEPEAFWEWPGMFWRWSTGPIRRTYAALRARASG
jgi:hypothetical protein